MVDPEVVKSKLIKLEEYIQELKEYNDIELTDYKNDKIKKRYLERTLQLALESILDIGNHIISDERLGSPNNNADIIKILTEHKIFDVSEEKKEQYIRMAKFRNILGHDYAEIEDEIIVNILNNHLEDFKTIFNFYRDYIG
ncbi:type VII toxin-antitoxin system HepT family RNase toxin [Halarsenatibacter silvermanii]|uniref:Uncharacterized conserved protein YutE, UPF0331/DUF86 family n=1 Tax=Halarsenatibacter silvermanii TaxID=321763 RepID=A0A1G9GTN0_9FIRM|nr:DUF86 domain-containing protein [Halarsenatibacter silvermanii]SDL04046.1 Uncharacterized conserved protein YutE, UPF0331/DUF86 family [Halarsenatibacter silvermanii]